jgi:hypothetical protein
LEFVPLEERHVVKIQVEEAKCLCPLHALGKKRLQGVLVLSQEIIGGIRQELGDLLQRAAISFTDRLDQRNCLLFVSRRSASDGTEQAPLPGVSVQHDEHSVIVTVDAPSGRFPPWVSP